MWQTLGCSSRIPSDASRRSRAIALPSFTNVGESTLMAYCTFVAMSSPKYTYDMPPSPSFLMML